MRRDGNTVKWTCFRASCGMHGVYRLTGKDGIQIVSGNVKKSNKPTDRKRYSGRTYRLTDDEREWFWQKYRLSRHHLQMWPIYRAEDLRYNVPITNEYGHTCGEMMYYFPQLAGKGLPFPKRQIYIDTAFEPMSWYRAGPMRKAKHYQNFSHDPSTLIVVEDQLSAIRASMYCDALALLGTDLTAGKRSVLARMIEFNYNRIIIALDSDAFKKATEAYLKLWALSDSIEIHRLTEDIKDQRDDTEFAEIIRR